MSNVNVYVGDDGDLHFVNGSGADTVIPFSKSSVKIYDIKVDTDPATNVGGGTINIKNDFPNYASMTSSNFKIGITSNACGVNNGNNYHSYVRTSLSYNSSSGVLTWNTWCEGNVWWYQNIGFIVAYAWSYVMLVNYSIKYAFTVCWDCIYAWDCIVTVCPAEPSIW